MKIITNCEKNGVSEGCSEYFENESKPSINFNVNVS